jgi:hypothetical protein
MWRLRSRIFDEPREMPKLNEDPSTKEHSGEPGGRKGRKGRKRHNATPKKHASHNARQ